MFVSDELRIFGPINSNPRVSFVFSLRHILVPSIRYGVEKAIPCVPSSGELRRCLEPATKGVEIVPVFITVTELFGHVHISPRYGFLVEFRPVDAGSAPVVFYPPLEFVGVIGGEKGAWKSERCFAN